MRWRRPGIHDLLRVDGSGEVCELHEKVDKLSIQEDLREKELKI